MISKLLVANRSEIARRVFRTCRSMGIGTVAVYSDVDRSEPFVSEADEAFALGGSAPAESYLRADRILEAARVTGADAIHPGYGFLAESPGFARAVIGAGLTWVGPSPEAIEAMGSKLESKRLMSDAGVPTLPSVEVAGSADEEILAAGEQCGYPVLVKASAGGGGKGMRIVESADGLVEAVRSARREAASAFGDDTVFLEPYHLAPRHVEVQVFGDAHGNVVSLFERECSIQRRHQKIVEESPSPAVDPGLRSRMSEAAVTAARAVHYEGAGTVEFLLHDGGFSFLEMNTRLQVEHPVTEEITGLDLVRLQLLVAEGLELPAEARQARVDGHAIEVRLYAEDPLNGFLPVTGRLHRFSFPAIDGIRVDSGVEDGSIVSVEYDPMLAKVIAWGPTRREAAARLGRALRTAEIHGCVTNRDLLAAILGEDDFLAGRTDTAYLERHDPAELGRSPVLEDERSRAALAAALAAQATRSQERTVLRSVPSGWRNNPAGLQTTRFSAGDRDIEVGYRFLPRSDELAVEVDGQPVPGVVVDRCSGDSVTLTVAGHRQEFRVDREGDAHHVDGPSGYVLLIEHPRFPLPPAEAEAGSLESPMPGKVLTVAVAEGDRVQVGDLLVVMEAMKMEHTLRAPVDGTVTSVRAKVGDQVEGQAVLVVIDGA
jgi:propionyl-CoA carboxylase alpha chain